MYHKHAFACVYLECGLTIGFCFANHSVVVDLRPAPSIRSLLYSFTEIPFSVFLHHTLLKYIACVLSTCKLCSVFLHIVPCISWACAGFMHL